MKAIRKHRPLKRRRHVQIYSREAVRRFVMVARVERDRRRNDA